MPICPSCRTGYEDSNDRCPACLAPKPPAPFDIHAASRADVSLRCSEFGLICLWVAKYASVLVAALTLFSAVRVVMDGELMDALMLLLAAVIFFGQFVAFGLAIKYASKK